MRTWLGVITYLSLTIDNFDNFSVIFIIYGLRAIDNRPYDDPARADVFGLFGALIYKGNRIIKMNTGHIICSHNIFIYIFYFAPHHIINFI